MSTTWIRVCPVQRCSSSCGWSGRRSWHHMQTAIVSCWPCFREIAIRSFSLCALRVISMGHSSRRVVLTRDASSYHNCHAHNKEATSTEHKCQFGSVTNWAAIFGWVCHWIFVSSLGCESSLFFTQLEGFLTSLRKIVCIEVGTGRKIVLYTHTCIRYMYNTYNIHTHTYTQPYIQHTYITSSKQNSICLMLFHLGRSIWRM